MPLSFGWFDGQQVECCYHGWRFDAHTGQCQLIPSLTADQKLRVDRIYAGSMLWTRNHYTFRGRTFFNREFRRDRLACDNTSSRHHRFDDARVVPRRSSRRVARVCGR